VIFSNLLLINKRFSLESESITKMKCFSFLRTNLNSLNSKTSSFLEITFSEKDSIAEIKGVTRSVCRSLKSSEKLLL